MPLRDHFHPPISRTFGWEGFHSAWPAMLVGRVRSLLPVGYIAEPRARMGYYSERNLAAVDIKNVLADIDIGDQHEYEVLIYDIESDKTLVAAVEFVSPGNKDRAEDRQAFVAKCLALLRQNVCLAIVDVVTGRSVSPYSELLRELGFLSDSALGSERPSLCAASCRIRPNPQRNRFNTWTYPVRLGEALPVVPLWCALDCAVPLDLEGSYKDTCQLLGIG